MGAAATGGSNVIDVAATMTGAAAGVEMILAATSGMRVATGAGLLGAAATGGANVNGAAGSKKSGVRGRVAGIFRGTDTATTSVRTGAGLAVAANAAVGTGARTGIGSTARAI
jgi:hypothetical protein